MKKIEIIDLCKTVAADYSGWEFAAGAFKNKTLTPCIKLINPLWTFSLGSALSQPVAGFQHKIISPLYKKILASESYWLSGMSLIDPSTQFRIHERFYDVVEDKAEEKIRRILELGMKALDENYDFSSEQSLFEKMPKDYEDNAGISYCLIRAYLGDFDFVRRYRKDEIKTIRPKAHMMVDKIIEHFGISMD